MEGEGALRLGWTVTESFSPVKSRRVGSRSHQLKTYLELQFNETPDAVKTVCGCHVKPDHEKVLPAHKRFDPGSPANDRPH